LRDCNSTREFEEGPERHKGLEFGVARAWEAYLRRGDLRPPQWVRLHEPVGCNPRNCAGQCGQWLCGMLAGGRRATAGRPYSGCNSGERSYSQFH
jgi:hypothetical protein